MATYIPTRINRTGLTGKVQELNPTTDSIDGRVLPDDLPPIWSATETYAIGATVFYNGRIWTARAAIPANTTPSLSRDSDWEITSASLTRITGSDGTPFFTSNNAGIHEIRFDVNQLTSGNGSVTVTSDGDRAGAGDAVVTVNFPPTGMGPDSGLTSVTSDNTLNGLGTSASPLSVADYFQKVTLFLGRPGTGGTTALGGANRNYTPYTTGTETNYFIAGVQINSAGDAFEAGAGVWTSDDPAGTVNIANTFNLIG